MPRPIRRSLSDSWQISLGIVSDEPTEPTKPLVTKEIHEPKRPDGPETVAPASETRKAEEFDLPSLLPEQSPASTGTTQQTVRARQARFVIDKRPAPDDDTEWDEPDDCDASLASPSTLSRFGLFPNVSPPPSAQPSSSALCPSSPETMTKIGGEIDPFESTIELAATAAGYGRIEPGPDCDLVELCSPLTFSASRRAGARATHSVPSWVSSPEGSLLHSAQPPSRGVPRPPADSLRPSRPGSASAGSRRRRSTIKPPSSTTKNATEVRPPRAALTGRKRRILLVGDNQSSLFLFRQVLSEECAEGSIVIDTAPSSKIALALIRTRGLHARNWGVHTDAGTMTNYFGVYTDLLAPEVSFRTTGRNNIVLAAPGVARRTKERSALS